MIVTIRKIINLQKLSKNNIYRYLTSGLNLWDQDISLEIKLKIENHWKEKLINIPFNENNNIEKKYYILPMFPYPSGYLHMGHVRVYTISDSIARFQRMNGKNVIHPIGWDAFGLPAENAAIERQIDPFEWTKTNINYMKSQLKELGCSFEWNRELATCDPNYYKWTQDLFLKLFKCGLVYQKEALVNWDPIDKTVLADEQVDENGCSWRSGAKVEKKLLKQWFIKTTKFAKDLYDGLDDSLLHDWRDIIKIQKHWIGECNGVVFDFQIINENKNFLTLWTPYPEHIESIKFVALKNSHILANKQGEILEDGTKKLDIELINPFNNEKIPIFITDQIQYLPHTDFFIGIPGICEKASIFADKFHITYKILNPLDKKQQERILKKAQQLNIGGYWTSAKLRDWLISRQRFWGTPIPIIHCDDCGIQAVPFKDLPIKLPKLNKLSQKGSSQLNELSDWINTICPNCKKSARRETDTMDTFVDSSWYYLRYLDPNNTKEIFNVDKIKKLGPVDLYVGGKEHAVLHLYYARFINHFLYSLGLLDEREPFRRLLVQGMVMGRSFRIKGTGQYLSENKVQIIDPKKNKAIIKDTGESVVMAWEKMSKSKFNGVDPTNMFKEYSVDTTRLIILADVAPTSYRNWNSNTFPGVINWQRRLWLIIKNFINYRKNPPPHISEDKFKAYDDYLFDSRNYYIKGATFNYCISQQHSISISKQQGLTNSLRKSPPAIFAYSLQFERALASQIILLAPMAPHFASELWSGFISAPNRLNKTDEINWNKNVLEQRWPQLDENYNLDLVCEINGEKICIVKIDQKLFKNLTKDEAINIALKQKEIQVEINSKTICNVKFSIYENYKSVININLNRLQKERIKL